MNVNPESPQSTDNDAAPAVNDSDNAVAVNGAAAPEAAKPVRRKRTVKPALLDAGAVEGEAPTVESAAADTGPDMAPDAAEAPPVKAPRRKRAPAAEVAEVAEVTDVGEAPAAVAVDAAPHLPAEPAVAEAPVAVDSETAAEAPDAAPGASADAPTGAGNDTESRSRRRGRRERRRGARAEAGVARDGNDNRLPGAEAADVDADADDEDDALNEGSDSAPGEATGPAEPPADVGEVFAQVLSGEFDTLVEPPADGTPALPPKRVLRAEPEAPKLHKVLAQAGVGSRRDMEELILDGQITVNNQPAHIGQRISFGDQIKVNGKPVRVRIMPLPPRIIAYHKPAGEVVTNDDPQARPTVFRRLPRLQQGKWQSVGRLDINTEGLLLFTNSGELANRLMHPRFGVEREYAVRVLGKLDQENKAKLLEGVPIEGQTASFRSVEDGGGEGANHWYRVVITEGRNREVRKLFDAVGLTVSRLIRIRYGSVVLPRGLKRGVWVDLDDADVRVIRQLAAAPGDRDGQGQGQGQSDGFGPRDNGRGRNNNNKGGERRPNGQPEARRNDRVSSNNGNGNNGNGNGGNGFNNGPRQQGPRPDGPRQNAAQDDFNRNESRADIHREGRTDLDIDDDFDPSRIPNPLEQTFDKRFVQNPRTPAGGRGFRNGGGGFGAGGSAPAPAAPQKRGEPRQPDPMQTSVGYIGGDAFHRKGGNRNGGGGGNSGGGGNRGGNRGGGGGGGYGGGGGQGQGGGGFGSNRRGR